MDAITKRRRNFAIVLFVLILVFFAGEVFAVMTAKNQHDYNTAKNDAEELSVELGLISAALNSGNKTLFDNSLERFGTTLDRFADNDYVGRDQKSLADSLSSYRDTLQNESGNIAELIELSGTLSSLQSNFVNTDFSTLDAVHFYQIEQQYQDLRKALANLQSSDFAELHSQLDGFADRIISLSSSAAVCVSICPRENFDEKLQQLESIKNDYAESFKNIGETLSAKYDPSEYIVKLNQL